MTSLNRRQFNRALLAVPAAAVVSTGVDWLAPASASAAPADYDAQVLIGQVGGDEGAGLVHQTRFGDGTWRPSWLPIAMPGTLLQISCVGLSGNLHVVAAINSGAPSHGARKRSDGSWSTFDVIPSQGGPTNWGDATVAVTSVGSVLHVFGAAGDGKTLYHTVRNEDGSWQARWVAVRTFATTINHIATTRVGTTIDTAVVTIDEKLVHAIRASDGTWSNWGNIENAAGVVENGVLDVAVAGIGTQLHVVALSSGMEAYHAIRKADGSWQRFRKVTALANYLPYAVSASNVGGELQIGVIDWADAAQIARHTIRRADGTWAPVRTMPTTGRSGSTGIIALAGTVD